MHGLGLHLLAALLCQADGNVLAATVVMPATPARASSSTTCCWRVPATASRDKHADTQPSAWDTRLCADRTTSSLDSRNKLTRSGVTPPVLSASR